MNRREIFKAGFAAGIAGLAPRVASAQAIFNPTPKGWRTFVLTTRVEPLNGVTTAWIPLPTFEAADWQRAGNVAWTGNAKTVERVRDPKYGAEMLKVEWASDQQGPVVEVTTQVQTQNRSAFAARPASVTPLSDDLRKRSLAGTELIPTDGLVKDTADDIVRGKKSDIDKARAIYEWVVENTFRNPKTLGCGVGDIASMIKTGNLNGKCADLNALFVGLARSAGLPARDVYGIRVVPSEFGYKALGAGSEVVTKAQHCRAEVWLQDTGWTPVDPADVRKVVLEEPPGNLTMINPKVVAARKTLFGAWEGNWVAFNTAADVTLPGSRQPPIGFLMYPQGENKAGPVDSLDPDAFKYRITARELTT
jgi:transglutaminase-like putative cysteine protease